MWGRNTKGTSSSCLPVTAVERQRFRSYTVDFGRRRSVWFTLISCLVTIQFHCNAIFNLTHWSSQTLSCSQHPALHMNVEQSIIMRCQCWCNETVPSNTIRLVFTWLLTASRSASICSNLVYLQASIVGSTFIVFLLVWKFKLYFSLCGRWLRKWELSFCCREWEEHCAIMVQKCWGPTFRSNKRYQPW